MWAFNWGVFWAVLVAVFPAAILVIYVICDQLEVVDRNIRATIESASRDIRYEVRH